MPPTYPVVNLGVDVVVDDLLEGEGLGSIADTPVQHTGLCGTLLSTSTALSVLPHTTGLTNVCGTCSTQQMTGTQGISSVVYVLLVWQCKCTLWVLVEEA